MRRRTFVSLLGGIAALVAWPGRAQKIPVIGYLVLSNPEPSLGYFKEGLRKLGYLDGKNIRIEFRNAEGKAERLAGLAAELVKLKVDVLVAAQTPAATAAKNATTQIPVVMAGVGDPVATGLIASLARPGGNITGITGTGTEMGAKVLERMRELLPAAKRVGVLANATDPFTKPFLGQLERAGAVMALEIRPIMIRETAALAPAFAEMAKRRTDVVIVQGSLQRKLAAELALQHRLPTISSASQFAVEGGLMGYSASLAELQESSALYADKILKGAKPADLPVQHPSKYELAINLQTAKALGLVVPKDLLLRADRVIY